MLFTAYNDLAWGTGQLLTRITRFTSPNGGSGLPSTGPLVDHATGADTTAVLTVTGGDYEPTVDSCGTGTSTCRSATFSSGPAFTIFDGIVDALGSISYITQASPGGDLVLTFSGLAPAGRYEVAYYWNRGDYAWTRSASVTISGALSFENTSTAQDDDLGAPAFSGIADPSTRIPADNPNGAVVRFSNVAPSAGGTFTLTVSSDTSELRGKYANALMFRRQL